MVESAPVNLLEAFTPDQLLRALVSRSLSHRHLEGAARFACRWKRKEDADSKTAFVEAIRGSDLRDQIREYIRSTNDESKIKAANSVIVVQVNGKVRAQFTAVAGIDEAEAKKKALELPELAKWLSVGAPKKVIYVQGKLVNIVV